MLANSNWFRTRFLQFKNYWAGINKQQTEQTLFKKYYCFSDIFTINCPYSNAL